ELSRPAAERVTKCTVELTLHMAIRGTKIYQVEQTRKGLSHFNGYFSRRTLPCAENYRILSGDRGISSATAVRIALPIEFAPAKTAGNQQHCGNRHNDQRHKLLPTHVSNIV